MGYIFDPNVLQSVIRGALDLPLAERMEQVRRELARRYPGHIADELSWIFNNAGGAMGQMAVLHASLTEYVLLFGTPIGTEGHSGRYVTNDYFIILEGEQWAYGEGELDRSVYRPGDMHHLPSFTARGYRIPEKCYALEYARGAIPTMLPFALLDTFTSTLDVVPLARTVAVYTKAVLRELAQGKI